MPDDELDLRRLQELGIIKSVPDEPITLEQYKEFLSRIADSLWDSPEVSEEDVARFNQAVSSWLIDVEGLDPEQQLNAIQYLPLYDKVVDYSKGDVWAPRKIVQSFEGKLKEWVGKLEVQGRQQKQQQVGEIAKFLPIYNQAVRDQYKYEQEAPGRFERQFSEDFYNQPRQPRAPDKEAPEVGGVAQSFLRTLSPKLKDFAQGELRDVYEEFLEQNPGARDAWWNALNKPGNERQMSRLNEMITRREKQLEAWQKLAGTVPKQEGYSDTTPMGKLALEAPSRADWLEQSIAGLQGRQEKMASQPKPKQKQPTTDPWLAYLQDYNWQQSYQALAPWQRGVQASRYAPPTVWR